MPNLAQLWTQLFSESASAASSLPSSQQQPSTRPYSSSKSNHHRSGPRQLLRRFLRGPRNSGAEPSPSISSSCSSSSARSYSPSVLSSPTTPTASYEHRQLLSHRRTVSLNQLNRRSHLNRSESVPTSASHQAQSPARHLPGVYDHPKFCQCGICQIHTELRFYERKVTKLSPNRRQSSIAIIAEEPEEEEEKLASSSPAVTMFQHKKIEKVVPFQKPEHLANLWHQAPDGLESHDNRPDVIKQTPRNSAYWSQRKSQEKDTISKLSVPTVLMDSRHRHQDYHRERSPTPPPDYLDDEGRCRSSASSFLRSHQLRSSCPPPSRPRRRSKTPNRSMKADRGSNYANLDYTNPPASDNSHKPLSQQHSSSSNLVEKVQSKLKLGSVRKSWLFSIFQGNSSANGANSTNSKVNEAESVRTACCWQRSDTLSLAVMALP